MSTSLRQLAHLGWIVPTLAFVGGVGYYLGDKDLAEVSSRLKAYEDAEKLPLASVVQEARTVLGELADREKLQQQLDASNAKTKDLELALKQKEASEAGIRSKFDTLTQQTAELASKLLPNEINEQIEISGNEQHRLPITGKLLGLVDTLSDENIQFAVGDTKVTLHKGQEFKQDLGALQCLLSPLNWSCCIPARHAQFSYSCKRLP